MLWLLSIGLVSSVLISGCTAACTEYDIQQCQQSSGILTFWSSLGIDITETIEQEKSWLFTLQREQLQHYCDLFGLYQLCMSREMYGCDDSVQALIKGSNKGEAYICTDTFEEYLSKHQACLAGDEVRDEIRVCAKKSVNRMQFEHTTDGLCDDLKSGEDCEVRAVKGSCGKKTAKWFKKFITTTSQPVKHYAKCDSIHGFNLFLIIFAALSAASLILADVCCGCKRMSDRRRALTGSGPISLPRTPAVLEDACSAPPPAYSEINDAFNSDKEKLVVPV